MTQVVKSGQPLLIVAEDVAEDAISATKAAMAEGIVPGAGLALLHAIEAVEREAAQCEGDERPGVLTLRHALEVPTRQVAENSGAGDGVVVDKMRAGTGAIGFDAARCAYVDLAQAGIVDPSQARAHCARERGLGREHAAPDRSASSSYSRSETREP